MVDKRSYENFSYFIELQKGLTLSENHAIGNTGIYEINFNKKNKQKKKDNGNEKKKEANINKEKNNKEKNNKEKSNKIASGVYVMKFKLTQNSFCAKK